MKIGILHEHSTGDIFQDPILPAGGNFDKAQIFLAGENFLGRAVERRSGDDFQEELRHFRRGGSVYRTIYADYASEGRNGVTFESAYIGFAKSLAGCHAAWVGVLDDGAYRLIEILREIPSRLQVDDVVVGEFLALELARIGYAHAGAVGIHCGLLVRVLPVAEVHRFLKR